MYDFLFDFNRHYGSILNRLVRNQLLPVYTSGHWQTELVLRRQQRSLEGLSGHQRGNPKPPQAKNGFQRALAAKPEVEIWTEICSIDFPTSISYSTSNTLEVYLQPLRLCSGELVSNTRTQDQRDIACLRWNRKWKYGRVRVVFDFLGRAPTCLWILTKSK